MREWLEYELGWLLVLRGAKNDFGGGRMHAVCGTTMAPGSAAKPRSRRRLRRWELREIAQLTTVLSVSGAVISFERRGIVVNLVQNAAALVGYQADISSCNQEVPDTSGMSLIRPDMRTTPVHTVYQADTVTDMVSFI